MKKYTEWYETDEGMKRDCEVVIEATDEDKRILADLNLPAMKEIISVHVANLGLRTVCTGDNAEFGVRNIINLLWDKKATELETYEVIDELSKEETFFPSESKVYYKLKEIRKLNKGFEGEREHYDKYLERMARNYGNKVKNDETWLDTERNE